MAAFTATVEVAAPAERVWARLVDWPAHARWVPLTRITVLTERPDGVGARFVGRSGLGRLAFDDPMEIVAWQPPVGAAAGRCEVIKQGRVVLGTADFTVTPSPGGCTVAWHEDIQLVPVRLTRPFGRLVAVAGRLAFTRTLRAMGAEVLAEQRADVG